MTDRRRREGPWPAGLLTGLVWVAFGVMAGLSQADEVVDLTSAFPGFRATFVLRDVSTGRTVRHDPALAAARRSPCSTFRSRTRSSGSRPASSLTRHS